MVKYVNDRLVGMFLDSIDKHQSNPVVVLRKTQYPNKLVKYDVWSIKGQLNCKKCLIAADKHLAAFSSFEEAMLWIELDLQIKKDSILQDYVVICPF
jgi:hypothetical protein